MEVSSNLAAKAGRWLLDALLPPRCLGCGAEVADPSALCAGCWEAVQFIEPPFCQCCGMPFEISPPKGIEDAGAKCGECLRAPPPYDRARAVFRYDDASRDLVLRFKHADRTDAAPAFAAWMARSGAELLGAAEIVVPVPLHRRRLFVRRFNQSALLAQALAKRTGALYWPDLLCRTRNTPSQGRLSPAGRRRNVAGAFKVSKVDAPRLKGARLLLVTTGATLKACAHVLKRAGASHVDVITLARVLRVEG